MTESRLRQIIAEEIRKALDAYRRTASVTSAETGAMGSQGEPCVKDTKGHTGHMHTVIDGGSQSSEQTAPRLGRAMLKELARLRAMPKPKRSSGTSDKSRTTGR